MLFSSMEFLFLFFPFTFIVYYLLPERARNFWLLFMSLFFYAWGEPRFVLIMMLSIAVNYLMARFIDHAMSQKWRRLLLAADVGFNLLLLFFFKYLNFTLSSINALLPSLGLPQTNIALPIGISFFTFQAMSYVIDVYRGIPVQRSIFNLGLYISFFPQLIAGPIVRYTTIMEQINDRSVEALELAEGFKRFIVGFNKKVLLANILAGAADAAYASAGLSVGMAWLGAVAYTLQIFFDFSGYSDMAIGLGRMFGFYFLENFDYPYVSATVTEFWRRWHISLGSWFRDYVYFPLGGSRVKSRGRLVFNLSVVWLLTGVWHGANWTFFVWGILHGSIIIVEKLLELPKRLPKKPVAAAVYRVFTLLAVVVGWVFFRADSLSQGVGIVKAMFGMGAALSSAEFIFQLRENAVVLAAALLCSTPLFRALSRAAEKRGRVLAGAYELLSWLVQAALLLAAVSYLVMDAHNPFIYFNF